MNLMTLSLVAFDWELVKELLGYIPAVCSIIVAICVVIKKNVKYIKEKNWGKVIDEVKNLISVAEKSTHYTGLEKRDYVLTKANQYAIENGIKFDSTKVGMAIDELVELTKKVNKREKDNIVLPKEEEPKL